LLDKLLSCMSFDSSLTNFHSVEKFVLSRLKQHGQGHACEEHEREIADLSMYSRTNSPPFWREELVHGHLGVILVESREKPCFQVNPRIDGAIGKAYKPIKGYPFKGIDEQSGHDSIIIYHIIGL